MENVNEGDRGREGDLLPPLQCDWDFPPHQEVGDENREVRAKVHCKATPGSLIDKLLNNPHASLQREPMRHQLPVETEHQQRLKNAVGHGRLDLTPVGDAWTPDQMQAAVDRGPHQLALTNDVISHFRNEVDEKVKSGQAKLVT